MEKIAERPRIVFLDWLRVIACFMVFTVHASECVYSNDYSYSFPSELARWSVCIINTFVRPAVPLFLMASAYLLIPVKTDAITFFKRRLMRVAVPFVVWLLAYCCVPALWGEFTGAEVIANLKQVCINFIPRESHLWFIYMLLSIYLIMPLISAGLEKMTRRDEKLFIGLWLITTFFIYLHEYVGDVFGECWWNPNPPFYYISGYLGYVFLAHYIRKYLDWSWEKTLKIALPLFLAGWAFCCWWYYDQSFKAEEVRVLELAGQPYTIAPAIMAFGAFMMIKKINVGTGKVYDLVKSISLNSYGMYLLHMMMLPAIYSFFAPLLPVPLTIFATTLVTYIFSYLVSKFFSLLPGGKYIVG